MATVVFVYDTAIDHAVAGQGGDGVKFVSSNMRRVMTIAIRDAPARSGELRASHINRGTRRTAFANARGSIANLAPHAEYVHEGTIGKRIVGRPFMIVPAIGGGGAPAVLSRITPGRFGRGGGDQQFSGFMATKAKAGKNRGQLVVLKRSVRGQRANPWLREAGYKVFGRFV